MSLSLFNVEPFFKTEAIVPETVDFSKCLCFPSIVTIAIVPTQCQSTLPRNHIAQSTAINIPVAPGPLTLPISNQTGFNVTELRSTNNMKTFNLHNYCQDL